MRAFASLTREPLVRFLAIGAAIFLLFGMLGDEASDRTDRIEVTAATVDRLSQRFERQWQRPPTAEELRALIEGHVREEVLVREALAMGLDRDDEIVRRRLAQKVAFLIEDLAGSRQPSEAELAAFYMANADRYRLSPRLSFTQVFFSTDRRGTAVERDAGIALATLRAGASEETSQTVGDATMLESRYRDLAIEEIGAAFGPDFAAAIAGLPVGDWSGPVASGYGLHLIRVDERTEGRTPDLSELRDRVLDDWEYEQRAVLNEQAYRKLLSRYDVRIEGVPGSVTPTGQP